MKYLVGRITAIDPRTYDQTVEVPDAESHLRWHSLSGWQRAKGGKVGDIVGLIYRTGPSYGLWVAHVFDPESKDAEQTAAQIFTDADG